MEGALNLYDAGVRILKIDRRLRGQDTYIGFQFFMDMFVPCSMADIIVSTCRNFSQNERPSRSPYRISRIIGTTIGTYNLHF